jgi:hypothetical protein
MVGAFRLDRKSAPPRLKAAAPSQGALPAPRASANGTRSAKERAFPLNDDPHLRDF